MITRRRLLAFGGVALAAGAAGAAFQFWRLGTFDAGSPEAAAQLLSSELPDPKGNIQLLGQWRGKVLVVNYWATWCAPCREEIPIFVKMQSNFGEKGLIFVGIAMDTPERVIAFARDFGINYPLLMGNLGSIEQTRQFGNKAGALPFTVIIDREGRVAARELGVWKEAKLADEIDRLL